MGAEREKSNDEQGSLSHAKEVLAKKPAVRITFELALGILISVGAAGVFAWIWDQVKDRNQDATQFDHVVLSWMHLHQVPWLTTLARVLAWFGNPPVIVVIAVLGIIVGIFWRKVRGAAWTLPIGVIGAAFIIQGVKLVFRRPRPSLFQPLLHETGFSFPSGHSLIAVVVYGLLGYFLIHIFRHHAAKVAVAICTAVLVILIGLSRVYVGVHFPTDVLAGWTGGIPWLITCFWIHEALTRRYAKVGEPVLDDG